MLRILLFETSLAYIYTLKYQQRYASRNGETLLVHVLFIMSSGFCLHVGELEPRSGGSMLA